MQYKRPYSRLAQVEQSRQTRAALKFTILTVGLVAFLLILGVPLLARLAGIAVTIEEDPKNLDSNDKTPPAPPKINSLNEWTREQEIKIEGNTEAGATVVIFVNNETRELIADVTGSFSTRMNLKKGDNEIYAKATDTNGNESQESRKLIVNYDNEPPKVEIIKPQSGEKFFGKQNQITVEGTTEPGANVTINGRVVIVGSDGKFVYPTTLGAGENNFNIKSTDQAGNLTELDVKVEYTQ